jgi:hypothetical protein
MRLATPFLSLALAALALLPAAVGARAYQTRFSPETGRSYVTQSRHTLRLADAGRFEWMPHFYGNTVLTTPTVALPTLSLPKMASFPFQDAPTLSVFPNPARGLVSVQLSAQHGPDYKLRLSNVLGREVRLLPLSLSSASTGVPLDVSGLPAGLYFCSLLVNDKAVSTNRLTLL